VVEVYVTNSGTGFAIGRHVGQLVILSECFAVTGGTNSARNIELFGHYIIPYLIYGMNVGCVSGKCGYICHARIHIGGTHGMSHGLVLLNNRFVSLTVFVGAGGISSFIKEELGLIQVLLVTGYQV